MAVSYEQAHPQGDVELPAAVTNCPLFPDYGADAARLGASMLAWSRAAELCTLIGAWVVPNDFWKFQGRSTGPTFVARQQRAPASDPGEPPYCDEALWWWQTTAARVTEVIKLMQGHP